MPNRETGAATDLYCGIEIGGTKLQLVVGDHQGRIEARKRLEVGRDEGGAGIRRRIEAALPELIQSGNVRAIGVGFGGPVDATSNRICCSHQVEGWEDFPLKEWLQDRAGKPVVIENDANVAALGESIHGAGSRYDPVFYVTQGSGVGGGLVAGGKLYHGASPSESEIGHVRLDRSGATVESRCSGWAVDRRIRHLAQAKPGGWFAANLAAKSGGESASLAKACAAGDPDALDLISEVAADLAFALSHVVHLNHPAMIILGGGFSLLGEIWRQAVAEALPPFLMQVMAPGPIIALAALREDAVPIGALELARRVAQQADRG